MTKEILVELLNSKFRWDVLDCLQCDNNSHFLAIREIWNDCLTQSHSKRFDFSIFNIFLQSINFGILWLLVHARLQLNMILKDSELAEIMLKAHNLKRRHQESMDEFLEKALKILNFYKTINLPLINVTQIIFLFKDLFFKEQKFQDLFNEKMADYILIQIETGSVSIQFLQLLQELTT